MWSPDHDIVYEGLVGPGVVEGRGQIKMTIQDDQQWATEAVEKEVEEEGGGGGGGGGRSKREGEEGEEGGVRGRGRRKGGGGREGEGRGGGDWRREEGKSA